MSEKINASQKKTIVYVANIRLPTDKAHGIQIVNTCQELYKKAQSQGYDFELVICEREQLIQRDIFEYYGIENPFPIHKIKTMHLHKPYAVSFFLQRLQFVYKLRTYLSEKYNNQCVVYCRDEFILYGIAQRISQIFLEAHEHKINYFFKKISSRLRGIVTISEGLKEVYSAYNNTAQIVVIPDAVNVSRFAVSVSKEDARKKVGLPIDKKIIMYIGSVGLYGWKGVDVFLEAGARAPEYVFVLVGGNPISIELLKQTYTQDNILFIGQQDPTCIPLYQKAADVLVIPNKSGNVVSEKYTSPMKMFEYMASAVPILSSDLPSLREVLHEDIATFFKANDEKDLLHALHKMFAEYDRVHDMAQKAQHEVLVYTYEARAEKIMDTITHNISI